MTIDRPCWRRCRAEWTSCMNRLQFFQQKNAVQLQSFFDALRLLEQNPIRKLDYHETIMRR
ncbi:Negative elongation factor, partial [Trichinella spiralis]